MKTMSENIIGVCLQHAHRVQHTSQRGLLFSNVSVRTVENALKRYCGRESIDAFWMKTKTHTFEIELVWTRKNDLFSLGVDDATIRG